MNAEPMLILVARLLARHRLDVGVQIEEAGDKAGRPGIGVPITI